MFYFRILIYLTKKAVNVFILRRQVGDLVFSESGLAQKGLILRHLVMPGLEKEAESILQWVREEVSADTYGNIMEQYHPDFKGK